MKFKQTTYLLVGAFLLPVITVCTVVPAGAIVLNGLANSSDRSTVLADQSLADADKPETMTATISVEGELTEVELQLFDQADLPFTTYVPTEDFTEEVATSEQGSGVRFYFSPTGTPDEDAYLHVFFPTDAPNPESMSELLIGEEGLLTENGWQVVDRTPSVRFPWAEERIVYEQSTPEGIYTGSIFVGEYEGEAFVALTHYPVEYGDGFEPRAEMILQNLDLRD